VQVVVRNCLARNPAYTFMPKTYTFEGEIVATPKWVDYPAIALSTHERKFPVRIIPQEDIISINNESFVAEKINPAKREFSVVGSKGDHYTVTVDGSHKTCTCMAFQFRRNCRHIVGIK
jgi:hypothetical protein